MVVALGCATIAPIGPIGLSVNDPNGGMEMKARHRLRELSLNAIGHCQVPGRQAPGAPMHRSS